MAYSYPKAVIQVFCKAPLPGQVKTRLMPELSATQAMRAHQQLTERTLRLICDTDFCPVQLWCSPAPNHPFFIKAAKDYPVSLKTQVSGDLGQRMAAALAEGTAQFQSALLIGCDCPSLNQADIYSALNALAGNFDCVLAPTEDGGYSLIGLKQAQPELFNEMSWSCPEVITETRLRLQRLQLTCYELRMQWDVDTYADYLRYLQLISPEIII